MTISKIKDIYIKDISQKVKWVIMAWQGDEDTIFTELEEFVITKELHKHIKNFFDNFNNVISNPNKNATIWVWISWFFWSWKSHLLKIFSYLLENKEVKWKTPLNFFEEKLKDDILLFWDIERVIKKNYNNTEIILFNIDSKAWKNSKNSKDWILEVFIKVFNEKLGYCADIPWLADFEHTLFMRWDYEKFKVMFNEVSGNNWDDIKDNFYFERENVIKALIESNIMSENDSNHWFNWDWKDYNMSVSKFAEIINKYCEKKGNNHKVIFLVDEIGQYIWDNTSLMLNLQTVTEDLWDKLIWKAWVIVTSQEAIDTITDIKWKDFSKIQWRFPTKLILSSANTDEVIKKRLLEKTKEATEELEAYYIKNETTIKNLFSFSSSTADMKLFKDEHDFSVTYPFIPYQFNLLQKVFEKIRVIWVAWSHIADWNRSMLNGYQEAWSSILDKKIGAIIPFSTFYNTIETFIWNQIKTAITQAKDNSKLESIDIEVLKLLFMIRYIKEIPCDLENITTLLISDIDTNKLELRNNIKYSLDRLISQTLIHKNGDEYLFLTNDEQNVNKEINAEEVDKPELLKHIWDVVFNDFYKTKKYSYSTFNIYDFNQLVDDYQYLYPKQYDLVLKITTSYSDNNDNSLFYSKNHALWEIRLENDKELFSNLSNLKKIEKWIKKNNTTDQTKNIRDIINDKSKETDESIRNWTIFINWKEISDIKSTSTVTNLFNEILNKLVINVYKNALWITKHYNEDEIIKILRINNIEEQTLINISDNKIAIEDIKNHILLESERFNKTTLKAIIEKYTSIPYWWNETDIAWIIANLFISWDIQFKYNEEILHKWDSDIIWYLTKNREYEKLVIQAKKQIDKRTIFNVKSIIQGNFDETDLSDNEDELFAKVKIIFGKQLEKLNQISSKYLVSNYPIKNIYDISKDTIMKYSKITDNLSLFNHIIEKKDEIEELEKNIRIITQFFNSQVQIYDDSKKKIAFYESEFKLFFPDDIAKIDFTKVEELRDILSSSSPYSNIKDLPTLLLEIKSWYREVLEIKKNDLLNKLTTIVSELEEYINKNSLSDTFKSKIISSFDEIKNNIEKNESCKELMALTQTITERNKSANSQITNEINRINDEKNILSWTRIWPSEKIKKQIDIEIDTILEKWVKIETIEDIDNYTNKLNKLLKEKLSSWENIRII
jgi:hypothetical protein